VLSKFTKEEQEEVDLAVQRAADAVTAWVVEGIQASMNQYNGSSS
jgi:peptidyl-tRNA hydrolase